MEVQNQVIAAIIHARFKRIGGLGPAISLSLMVYPAASHQQGVV